MKFFAAFFYFLLFFSFLFAQNREFVYVDPLPGAEDVNLQTSIIISVASTINPQSLHSLNSFSVKGSKSGNCAFILVGTTKDNVVLLKPLKNFETSEVVTVTCGSSIKYLNGDKIQPYSFTFRVKASKETNVNESLIYKSIIEKEFGTVPINFILNASGGPLLNVVQSSYPSAGKIFISNFAINPGPGKTPMLIIADNKGNFIFQKEMTDYCYDFNVQPNGHLTYFHNGFKKFYEMDENYTVIDSFYTGNGYATDLHELRLLPNRHALLMSYDTKFIDSSGSRPKSGGFPNTQFKTASVAVVGLIIQEIDENKNVVFQWRSWDHFKISDATHEDMGASVIDYVHGNAIELDHDGHLMISSRHMDEITKINRQTGNIIWRLGGKNNDFTFINDPDGFSHQHAIRRIENGNITLYDNGNFHNPPYSRAVEYKLDEINMTATLVWQYRNNPDVYGRATGYVQRLDNGNTLICWGLTPSTLTEVRYDGTKVLEMNFSESNFAYRSYKYLWKETLGDEILPSYYSVMQNYPNPFNPQTTIKFKIPQTNANNTPVKTLITIYDILGSKVAEILNDNFVPGTYEVNWNASGFPSGVYYYRLESGSFTETKKMVLIK